MRRNFRKPLILMTPKSLLRHKEAVSPVGDFTGDRFHELLDDVHAEPGRVRRVLLCSGKVFYDLREQQTADALDNVAIVRVEQLAPFPEESIKQVLGRYRNAREWVWVQEESQNMGAWTFIEPRLRGLGHEVRYVGRDASASPATGSHHIHAQEQKELVAAALTGPAPHLVRAFPDGRGIFAEQGAAAVKLAH
jgi:2-oxoglutarate dehydrogenase E1 component